MTMDEDYQEVLAQTARIEGALDSLAEKDALNLPAAELDLMRFHLTAMVGVAPPEIKDRLDAATAKLDGILQAHQDRYFAILESDPLLANLMLTVAEWGQMSVEELADRLHVSVDEADAGLRKMQDLGLMNLWPDE
jgi:hypothetical protein